MRVILRSDIESLGKLGEVVEVKDGYARNFLLPRQMAYLCTVDAEKQIEAERRRQALQETRRQPWVPTHCCPLRPVEATGLA